jgi:hypothetical protein
MDDVNGLTGVIVWGGEADSFDDGNGRPEDFNRW